MKLVIQVKQVIQTQHLMISQIVWCGASVLMALGWVWDEDTLNPWFKIADLAKKKKAIMFILESQGPLYTTKGHSHSPWP